MFFDSYNARWTKAADQAVMDAVTVDGIGIAALAQKLGRTESAIVSRVRLLGVHKARTDVWSEARTGVLKQLYLEGLSASRIAAVLGGVTRNAVIGKCHRLGLLHRTIVLRKKNAQRVATSAASPTYERLGRKLRSALPVEPLPPRAETDIPRMLFNDVTDGLCKWVVGDFHPAMCCGDTSVPTKSYCSHHLERARKPLRERTPSITYARPQVGYVRLSHAV